MLHFESLRKANADRCKTAFHPIEEWSETDWGCAIAGEVGEALNLVKKRRRMINARYNNPNAIVGPNVNADLVVDELADAVIYIDLLCTRMGKNLEDGIRRKFNEVSQRVGSDINL